MNCARRTFEYSDSFSLSMCTLTGKYCDLQRQAAANGNGRLCDQNFSGWVQRDSLVRRVVLVLRPAPIPRAGARIDDPKEQA